MSDVETTARQYLHATCTKHMDCSIRMHVMPWLWACAISNEHKASGNTSTRISMIIMFCILVTLIVFADQASSFIVQLHRHTHVGLVWSSFHQSEIVLCNSRATALILLYRRRAKGNRRKNTQRQTRRQRWTCRKWQRQVQRQIERER